MPSDIVWVQCHKWCVGPRCVRSDYNASRLFLASSPAESWKIQEGVCILSYKHEILHKGAFGCALSYLSKRETFFFQYGRQIRDGRHRPF